ncbi:MAG TPA: CHAT domain-containing protein [Longimicrobium sp.]
MRKVKVLFFAADPLSTLPNGAPRLLLDEEVRRVQKRVNSAVFGNLLDFDWQPAATVGDLQQKLEGTRPQIVHFSGHGGSRGLVLAGADGKPRYVDAAVLRELFQKDPGAIKLVVLTACNSLPQAEAIMEVVGCAIGANDRISDDASIEFNAKFYSAIASGRSVQDAFERARMALRLGHPDEAEILQLLHRDEVDPAKIVLVSRFRRFALAGAIATAALITAGVFLPPEKLPPPPSGTLRLGDCTTSATASTAALSRSPVVASAEQATSSQAATSLDQAKAFCRAGNYDSAFVYFKEAAGEDDPEAMSFLAIAYLSGAGTKPDTALAIHWLEQGAKEKRDPRGMNALAVLYENDERMNARYYWARRWYENAAEKGFAESMRNLGRHYRMGLGVARSDSIALDWYQKAAREGSAEALVDIGRMHEEGLGGGKRNPAQALRLYGAAAEAGSPLGMNMLGRAYQEGIGTPPDFGQAHAWYFKGACAGSAEAMTNLGLLYQHGFGVPADRDEAVAWFKRAADAGSSVAATNLARLKRRGVRKVIALLDGPSSSFPASCAAPTPRQEPQTSLR